VCTIITLFQVHPAYPLIIAANRDEQYARPSSGPMVLAAPPAVVAGRDLEFGGSWFGLNAQGLAVAVSDQGLGRPAGGEVSASAATPDGLGAGGQSSRGRRARDTSKRSRGLLVLDALGCASVDAVSAILAGIAPKNYNPFTLLHADAAGARIGHHTDGPVEIRALVPGVDVMVSAIGADHARWRSEYVLGALDPERLARLDEAALCEALGAVLCHHAPSAERDDAICRHRADSGTVSSFVALLAPNLAASHLHCALGAPCRTPYADYAHLLRELAGARV
jgi:hypothetical protein